MMTMKASALALAYLQRQAKTCESPERREKFRQMAEKMLAEMEQKR